MKNFDFVGFGALNVDLFYKLLPGIGPKDIVKDVEPGGEISCQRDQLDEVLKRVERSARLIYKCGGGQAANTAVALSRMGFNCGFIGKVGNDVMSEFLLESLDGVDRSFIRREGNSNICICIIDEHGERTNIVFAGSDYDIELNAQDIAYAYSAKVLYLTSFCNDLALDIQSSLAEHKVNGTLIALDPGEIYSRLGIERLSRLIKHVNILFATAKELEMLMAKDSVDSAKCLLERYGVEIVICKMGERGSIIYTKDSQMAIPAVSVEKVVDKTGAGDVYAAGFLSGLLYDLPLEKCGRLASRLAAISITGFGRERYPDRRDLIEFINSSG